MCKCNLRLFLNSCYRSLSVTFTYITKHKAIKHPSFIQQVALWTFSLEANCGQTAWITNMALVMVLECFSAFTKVPLMNWQNYLTFERLSISPKNCFLTSSGPQRITMGCPKPWERPMAVGMFTSDGWSCFHTYILNFYYLLLIPPVYSFFLRSFNIVLNNANAKV